MARETRIMRLFSPSPSLRLCLCLHLLLASAPSSSPTTLSRRTFASFRNCEMRSRVTERALGAIVASRRPSSPRRLALDDRITREVMEPPSFQPDSSTSCFDKRGKKKERKSFVIYFERLALLDRFSPASVRLSLVNFFRSFLFSSFCHSFLEALQQPQSP